MLKIENKMRILLFTICGIAFFNFVKNKVELRAEAEENEQVTEDVYEASNVDTIQLNLYDGDYDNYKAKLAKTITVESSLKLEEKVKKVAKSLSETLYNNLPIETSIETSIENRDGKKVAIINLVEPISSNNKIFKEKYAKMKDKTGTWQYYFSSGEAKAIVTLASIEETFAQPEYFGEWIDGYMIYHNGETLEDYRKNTTTEITWIKK